MIILKFPENGSIVRIVTEKQLEFLSMDRTEIEGDTIDWFNLERRNKSDDTFPLSVKFMWTAEKIASLQISETKDFCTFLSFRGDKSCDVNNLKSGTRYYWRVKCCNETSEIFTFETENVLPRWIKIDGLTNVRDCGGWKTADDKRIKQGMLYRGSELNSHVKVTSAGLKIMREELKIKSVLDIRGKTELVRDIYKENYINIIVKPYGEYIDNPETNREIFGFLSDEANYPIYLHCWGGADRTGTIVFLLNALLGVDYKDLVYDYEATTLSIWGIRSRNTDIFKSLIEKLNQFEGKTINEKAEKFILWSGVTEEQIERIKRILLC